MDNGEFIEMFTKILDRISMKTESTAKVKLIKTKELEDAEVPNNKPEGYEKEGFMVEEPKVGDPFLLVHSMSSVFRTSPVTEIIDADTFKTLNSIYKIIRK